MAGLLLGVLVLVSLMGEVNSGKHHALSDHVKDDLQIIDLKALKKKDPAHGWVVMIVYFMHGHDGKGKGANGKAAAVHTLHNIGGHTHTTELLDSKTGLHSHASVVAMLRQMDHDGAMQKDIEDLEHNHPDFCDELRANPPKPAPQGKKCYNGLKIYTDHFHNNTDLHVFHMVNQELTDNKLGGSNDPDGAPIPPDTKVALVDYLEKHHSDKGVPDAHNENQQILVTIIGGSKRVGVLVLHARDDDNVKAAKGAKGVEQEVDGGPGGPPGGQFD
jgi:hypothetical protein